MITRLLLSLKKIDASQEYVWSLESPTAHTIVRFAGRRGGGAARVKIPLDTSVNSQERIQSQG